MTYRGPALLQSFLSRCPNYKLSSYAWRRPEQQQLLWFHFWSESVHVGWRQGTNKLKLKRCSRVSSAHPYTQRQRFTVNSTFSLIVTVAYCAGGAGVGPERPYVPGSGGAAQCFPAWSRQGLASSTLSSADAAPSASG